MGFRCPRRWGQPKLMYVQSSTPADCRIWGSGYRKFWGSMFRHKSTLPHRNEFSWTKLISNQTTYGNAREALGIYKEMREEGVIPKTYTFVAALKAASSIADIESGMEIHAHVIESGHQTHIFVANSLMSMYSKCGNMLKARWVFEKMQKRDVVSWNTIIMAYAHMDMGETALHLYTQFQLEVLEPDSLTFVAALKACASLASQEEGNLVDREVVKVRALEKGRAIHCQVTKSQFESDIHVVNTLLHMYAKCGSMVDAVSVFGRMSHCDVVSWTVMIIGFSESNGELALQLYGCMQQKGFIPDARIFVAVLKACGSLAVQEASTGLTRDLVEIRSLEEGRRVHAQIANIGSESDIFVTNALMDMYAKCGSMLDAWRVFEMMPYHDVISWNIMIMGYAQGKLGKWALQLYSHMQHEGFIPNASTFVAAIKACSVLRAQEGCTDVCTELRKMSFLDLGKMVHVQAAKCGFESDLFVACTLIDMYAKCGYMMDALQVFERMPSHTVVIWNAIITGYTQMERGDLALQLYVRMKHEGFKPDARTFIAALKACSSLGVERRDKEVDGDEIIKKTCLEHCKSIHAEIANVGLESETFVASTLIDIYAECGSLPDAYQTFEKVEHRTVVLWNTMIMGYAQMEMGEVALQTYSRMQRDGFTPDAFTFIAALKACSSLVSIETGKEIHAQICRVGLECDPFVASSLIDMYSKCGNMESAQLLFDALPLRDLLTWNALVAGYGAKGESQHVSNLLNRMQCEDVQPDGITFVSILTACSHTGLVKMGQKFFQAMCLSDKVTPWSEHYHCMIDLLGRAGMLDEAVNLAKKMPLSPDSMAWMNMLSSCQKWNNVEFGRHSFECALELDQKNASAYLLMMNIYVSVHMWVEYARIMELKRIFLDGECWNHETENICLTISSHATIG